MPNRWVVNASPIILLAKAEVIRFLPQLCDELVIPQGVVGEVHSVLVTDAGRIWLSKAKPALEKLRGVGAWVSDELLDRAIELAGEA